MRFDSVRAAASLGVAFLIAFLAVSIAAAPQSQAQGADPKASDQRPAVDSKEGGKKPKKPDEYYAETERLMGGGPAASAECVWLGQNVVRLLWSNDIDTAFRHLDLYDRFGCPAGHIQTAFRCAVRTIDPKAAVDEQVHACWTNPNADPVITPPAAASVTGASQAR
jgi:hypothetical protein